MILALVVVATYSAPVEEQSKDVQRSERIIGIFSPTNRGRLSKFTLKHRLPR